MQRINHVHNCRIHVHHFITQSYETVVIIYISDGFYNSKQF